MSSLGYVTNWWLIGDHQSYFVSSGRPPMLQHLWSLAIEEQYYVLWATTVLLLTAGARWGRGAQTGEGRLRLVAFTALLLAAGSTITMVVIAVRTNVPYVSDSSRVYFGTDTHSMGLLLGSAGGAWAVLRARQTDLDSSAHVLLTDLVGVIGLVVLVRQFRFLSEYTPGLYRGGYLVLCLLTILIVCAVVRERSVLGRVLDVAPLRWLGQRSYSIYLWHWPVIVVTRPGVDLRGPAVLIDAARLGLILILAAASYRFVECPFRAAIRRPRTGPRERADQVARPERPALARHGRFAGVTGLVCVGILGLSAAAAATADGGRTSAIPATPRSSTMPSAQLKPHAGQPSPASRPSHRTSPHAGTPRRPTAADLRRAPPSISAFGDSVLLGASSAMDGLDPNMRIDAVEGRQAYRVLDDITAQHQGGQLGLIVVIHVGNNGVIDPAQLSSTLTMLRDRPRVILMTDRVPRDWQGPNNQTIRDVAHKYANILLIDWNTISGEHPEWFYGDGLHLNPAGATRYAQLIISAATS